MHHEQDQRGYLDGRRAGLRTELRLEMAGRAAEHNEEPVRTTGAKRQLLRDGFDIGGRTCGLHECFTAGNGQHGHGWHV